MTWLGTTIEIGGELVMYRELNMWYLYWTSFHWCISQTTLGAIELVAANTAERVLSVVLMLFGLLINSTLVSSCSAILVGIQMRAAGEAKQAWELERFLHQNRISGVLAGQVRRIVVSRLAKPNTLLEVDVPSLKALPSSMLAELRAGIYWPHLETHPFFGLMFSVNPRICCELCGRLNFQLLQAGDELFQPGTACEHVHLMVSGDMKYEQDPVSSPVPRCVSKDIKGVQWLSEAGLWTHWIHVGRLEARSEVKLLVVVPGHVISCMSKNMFMREVMSGYAIEFQKRLCEAKPPFSSTWPTDIEVPDTEFSDIIMGMDRVLRMWICVVGVKNLRSLSPQSQKSLIREVLQRTADLTLNNKLQLECVVQVLVLEVRRDDGCLLVQIGKTSDDDEANKIIPSCALLGGTHRLGTRHKDFCKILLDTKLGPLKDCIFIEDVEFQTTYMKSTINGVQTRVNRAVYHAKMLQPFEVPTCRYREREGERRDSIAECGEKNSIVQHLVNVDVHVFRWNGSVSLCAWLSRAQYEHMVHSGDSAWFTETWLSGLEPDPTVAPASSTMLEVRSVSEIQAIQGHPFCRESDARSAEAPSIIVSQERHSRNPVNVIRSMALGLPGRHDLVRRDRL